MSEEYVAPGLRPQDITWVRAIFGAPAMRDRRLRNQRLYSNAQTSFSDTTLGGNQALNAPPQFSRYADPAVGGLFANPKVRSKSNQSSMWENEKHKGSYRLGAYYQETIEDNAFYLHCRFGKPKYTGSIAFFANMYDSNIAHLARTGDTPGILRAAGAYLGATAIWAAVGTVPFMAIMLIPRVLKSVLNVDASRYYYVKPTMHLFMRAWQNQLNTQLIHYRLVPIATLPFMADQYKGITNPSNKYHSDAETLYEQLPAIWKDSGEFDVYKMTNRYQTLANYQAKTLDAIYGAATDEADLTKRLAAFYSNARFTDAMQKAGRDSEVSLRDLEYYHLKSKGYDPGFMDAREGDAATLNALNARYEREMKSGEAPTPEDLTPEDVKSTANEDGSVSYGGLLGDFVEGVTDVAGSISEQAAAEFRDGAQWLTFRVSGKDTVSKTITNQTGAPSISDTVNSLTSKARSLDASTSGGKTGINFADTAMSAAKEIFRGTLDTLQLTGLAALYNSSVVDFPETWTGADSSGDDYTFTIPLRAWSGNDLDVFQDLIVPTTAWITAACPHATGKQSFVHPFYLEAYSRGRLSIRNGIITSLTITMGQGNMAWRPDGVPLGIDLQITIKDLTTKMFMPLSTDPSTWDTDNKFSDYMGILGAASLHEKVYGVDKAVFNFNRQFMSWKSAFSVGARVNQIGAMVPARILAGLTGGMAR